MSYGTTMQLVLLSALALVSLAQDMMPCFGCDDCSDNEQRFDSCSQIEVETYDNGKKAVIDCKGQVLDCTKLPQLAFGGRKPIKILQLHGCAVNSSLECVLSALNATGTDTLATFNAKTAVTEETVLGLGMIQTLLVYITDVQKSVPVEALKLLPNLRMLRLSDVGLTAIAPHTFSTIGDPKNQSFEYLEISLNNIKTLPADVFNGLSNLKNLTLYNNKFKEIDANTFRGLISLEQLYLGENEISDLPVGVFHHMPQLRYLTMPRNRRGIQLKAGVISELSQLTELVLQSSEQLILDSRSLSSLPSLTSIDLQNSGIANLPSDLFFNSTAIVSLLLNDNKLSSLPETVFEGLVKLQKLDLTSNKLEKVTRNMFESLVELKEIYLNGNLIEVLPERLFSTMSYLEIVSIASNGIKTIYDLSFKGASSVTSLDLSWNKLSWDCPVYGSENNPYQIPTGSPSPIENLINLETLDLSHNNISRVCDDWQHVMINLRNLNLAYNNMTEVRESDVNFLSNNITVDLRNNRITNIYTNYNNQEHLPTLKLGHNPFRCDCSLYNFLRKLNNLPYLVQDATCDLPLPMRGLRLNSGSESTLSTSVSLHNLTCPLPKTPQGCTCVFRPVEKRTECNCDTLNITLPDPAYLNSSITKMLLTLRSKQNLKSLPSYVNQLNLSHLQLETVPDIPETVTHVDLSNNNLGTVPMEILNRGNLTLELRNNPIKCGCWNKEVVRNIQDNLSKVTEDNEHLTCADGTRIGQVDTARLCDVYIGISLATFGLLAIASALVYRYSLEIIVWLYYHGCKWLLKEESLDANKIYDIFLSFAHEDFKFVTETLLPKLDKEYKVCVHTRDWIIGDTIVEQIYRSVAESRRTLIVLSKDYLKSGWAVQEFIAANRQAEVDKRPRAVVILRDNVKHNEAPEQIKTYLGMTTYIEWGDRLFWERLSYALPGKLKAGDLKMRQTTALAVKNLAKGGLNVVYNEEGKLVNAADLKILNAADLKIGNATDLKISNVADMKIGNAANLQSLA